MLFRSLPGGIGNVQVGGHPHAGASLEADLLHGVTISSERLAVLLRFQGTGRRHKTGSPTPCLVEPPPDLRRLLFPFRTGCRNPILAPPLGRLPQDEGLVLLVARQGSAHRSRPRTFRRFLPRKHRLLPPPQGQPADPRQADGQPGKGAQIARSAGTYAQVMAREGDYATLRLPSGEIRLIHVRCRATIGTTSNPDHMNIDLGKAGRSRWLGIRPKTRGVAMNPIDHPMGGGEGRHSGGHPRSPWGQPAKGYKTRKRNKPSNKYILRRRNATK